MVVFRKGNISLTYSGIFFWLNTDAVLSKARFYFFITLPFIVLTIIPLIACMFVSDYFKDMLVYILCINVIISGADIINSILILFKPANSEFCCGFYNTKKL
ncbi:metalloprotease family protein [Paludicola sp. MB14-C6]|uniref:metalloprotease family protein n=1 Tax=Paludihabitans sp. MB14-C6 TaxID=3070656 RepID=UPI0035A27950